MSTLRDIMSTSEGYHDACEGLLLFMREDIFHTSGDVQVLNISQRLLSIFSPT